jgi:hypothetical protein
VESAKKLGFTVHHYADFQKLEDFLSLILGA